MGSFMLAVKALAADATMGWAGPASATVEEAGAKVKAVDEGLPKSARVMPGVTGTAVARGGR
jgi:hypothetical protein